MVKVRRIDPTSDKIKFILFIRPSLIEAVSGKLIGDHSKNVKLKKL
jgi:hypothetical protein